MSLIIQPCIACDNAYLSTEDLLRQAFTCDSSGNVYLRVYNPSMAQVCGSWTIADIVTRTIDGIDHTGFVVDHGLGKINPFITMWDSLGHPMVVSGEIDDANTVFLITDGENSGTYCIQ